MKNFAIICTLLLSCGFIHAQKGTTVKEPAVPCTDQANADGLPGKYYDHSQPKYPMSLKASSAQEKTMMLNQLIALEKIEENSRTNFTVTGCTLRTSFSSLIPASSGKYLHTAYSYQLAAYQNVCHVVQHIVKIVDEYRTVLRVNINPAVATGMLIPGGTGEFYLTDKDRSVRYEIPIEAIAGAGYDKGRSNPSRISKYMSEEMVLTSRSDDYKNKHADFLKIINGDGFVESWMNGSRYDKPNPKAYKWIDRHWLITRPGIPLLVPVTRKQYLEDLLEYYEIEKANFYYSLEAQVKNSAGNTSEYAKRRMAVLEADRAAYPKVYEDKKAKVKELLATQKTDWLQKPAVVSRNDADGNKRLQEIGKFYDAESDSSVALYIYNPGYFEVNSNQPTKPVLFEIQFRYEKGEGRGFSERLFNNFLKNYDLDALRKMLN